MRTSGRAAALARNQYWTAAAWLLERKYPDEYGKTERQRDAGSDEAAPRIVLGVVAKPVQPALFDAAGAPAVGEGSSSPNALLANEKGEA